MKLFIEITGAIKGLATFIFSGLIIVYTVFGGFFGLTSLSFGLVWQAIFIAFIASGLHFIVFSGMAIQMKSAVARHLLFGASLLLVLLGFAYLGAWFPAGRLLNWVIFVALCVFFFGAAFLAFRAYFRITGKKYTEVLHAYQNKQA